MIGFKQIDIEDKEILKRFFDYNQNQNSECTFTNLYMWRRCYAVRWAIVEGCLVIQPNAFENSWILPPYSLNDDDEAFEKALLEMAKQYAEHGKKLVVRAVTEKEKERIEKVLPGKFHFEEERDIEDYIYAGENLRELKGRKYSKKRNHLNAFFKEYANYSLEKVDEGNAQEVLDFVEHWCGKRNCENFLDDSLLCERKAIYDAFEMREKLDFTGAALRIDGEIVAFTMGEMINSDTVVIHIEKAYPEYRGLYPAINKLFLSEFWPDVTYVNREEDMGLPGLRKAKESYYPEYLLTKYKGEWIDE